jgi:hypothetical protein
LGGLIVIYLKLSYGYVQSSFDSETGDCISMTFIPDGRVERRDESGEAISEEDSVELENMEKEVSLDMVQP